MNHVDLEYTCFITQFPRPRHKALLIQSYLSFLYARVAGQGQRGGGKINAIRCQSLNNLIKLFSKYEDKCLDRIFDSLSHGNKIFKK